MIVARASGRDICYPYNDDDSIPKFFIREYQDIFAKFIPILINDFERENINKKKIK